jgi:hypothetical protein
MMAMQTKNIKETALMKERRSIKRFMMAVGLVCGILCGRAEAAENWTACVPVEVATYQGRIHVRCASAVGGINFFAASTQDTAYAARLMAVLVAAQVAGRTVNILYDPADQSGAAIGCAVTDCRLIRAATFGR